MAKQKQAVSDSERLLIEEAENDYRSAHSEFHTSRVDSLLKKGDCLRKIQGIYANRGNGAFLRRCRETLRISKSTVYRELKYSRILQSLSHTRDKLPANDRELAALSVVPAELVSGVWEAVCREAGDKPVTAALIRRHTAEWRPTPKPRKPHPAAPPQPVSAVPTPAEGRRTSEREGASKERKS